MIILDTNVVSEMMKPQPNPTVRDWLNAQAAESLFLSSITLAEILFGIAALPSGKRKDRLEQVLDGLMTLFRNRVLPFDAEAARRYAELALKARISGRGFPTPDGYIAAIAASRSYLIASRDTAPYAAAGLPFVDPWQA
jgi:toxin FitB